MWLAWRLPGAGSLHQYAPLRVAAGQVFEVTVRAGVWGSGGAAHQRYADMRLQVLLDSLPHGPELTPTSTARIGEQVEYRFALRAPERRTTATSTPELSNTASGAAAPTASDSVLDWRLSFVFDGRAQHAGAPRPVVLER